MAIINKSSILKKKGVIGKSGIMFVLEKDQFSNSTKISPGPL